MERRRWPRRSAPFAATRCRSRRRFRRTSTISRPHRAHDRCARSCRTSRTSDLHYDFHRDKRVTTLKGYDFPALHARTRAMADVRRTKREIVSLLKDEGEQFASWLVSLTPDFLFETYTDPAGANPRTRFENLLSAKEHEMHHRGQLMLIQRMLGITPHLTRQADERNRARAATSSGQSTAR